MSIQDQITLAIRLVRLPRNTVRLSKKPSSRLFDCGLVHLCPDVFLFFPLLPPLISPIPHPVVLLSSHQSLLSHEEVTLDDPSL